MEGRRGKLVKQSSTCDVHFPTETLNIPLSIGICLEAALNFHTGDGGDRERWDRGAVSGVGRAEELLTGMDAVVTP